jgi:hypothetical protein
MVETINVKDPKKTSISIDDDTLKKIDDYRRKEEKIPTLSKAILDLIHRGLEEKKEIIKEPELPKEAKKLEGLTIRIREPQKDRGGSSLVNLPFQKMKSSGFKDRDSVDVWITRKI